MAYGSLDIAFSNFEKIITQAEIVFFMPPPQRKKNKKKLPFFPQNPIFHDQILFFKKTFWS